MGLVVTATEEKRQLFERGKALVANWCQANGVVPPAIVESADPVRFGTCAYYRDGVVYIHVASCATYGRAGRQWSWPGYVVDRTPYGVLAHELGHHTDRQHGPAGGVRSHLWRPLDAKPLTGYCPNDNEWYAELFRLFCTNPSLFRAVRPAIEDLFLAEWPAEVETRPWRDVLAASPRHIRAAENKIRHTTRPVIPRSPRAL